ncbi:MAG TPA: zf-HC2 domain-containing protein [Prolixibacteraceae bacterium]|nr:zf-HC2 domain-containing protein [Prolixibacteraceae bacterium]
MDCKKAEHKIGAYISGTLDKAVCSEVEEHINHCPDCMKLYKFMTETMAVIDFDKDIKPGPFLYTRIKARQTGHQTTTINWRTATVFATLVLVVGMIIGTALGRATIPVNEQETHYTMAYLFDDTQIESLENTLLNDNTE